MYLETINGNANEVNTIVMMILKFFKNYIHIMGECYSWIHYHLLIIH